MLFISKQKRRARIFGVLSDKITVISNNNNNNNNNNNKLGGYNNARYIYLAKNLLCIGQQHLAQGSLNVYTTGSVAQELWEQSVVMFLLTPLEINIFRSSTQKASQIFITIVKYWFYYCYFNLKLQMYEW
jgi:hypothetical protein